MSDPSPSVKPFGWPAPRCGAWGRQAQRPCRLPVVKGKNRCWLHGGRNPGRPKGFGLGNSWALKHGKTTAVAKAERKERTAAVRAAKQALEQAVTAADVAAKQLRKLAKRKVALED